MKKNFKILIADRNRHVRKFLKRELMAEGYQVLLAENGLEVLKWVYHHEPLDLLILDPNLPDTDESSLLKKLLDRIPTLPVVFHTFHSDYTNQPAFLGKATFVEKEGNSVEHLKRVVFDILRKSYHQQKLNRKGQ